MTIQLTTMHPAGWLLILRNVPKGYQSCCLGCCDRGTITFAHEGASALVRKGIARGIGSLDIGAHLEAIRKREARARIANSNRGVQ